MVELRIPSGGSFNPESYLVFRKYGHAANPPEGRHMDEPYDREGHARYVESQQYAARLRALPSDELQALVQAEKALRPREQLLLEEAKERSYFFNKPDAMADYGYWGRMPLWKIEEATALSLGRDPRRVNSRSVDSYKAISAFAKRYHQLKDLLELSCLETWRRSSKSMVETSVDGRRAFPPRKFNPTRR